MSRVMPILPIGPGEIERRRLVRVVRSLMRHEPGLADYVVVYDGVDPEVIKADLAGLGPMPLLVENPRRGRGGPNFDGLTCGLTAAYGVVAERYPGWHGWKIDSDAYVIGPCRERIAERLASRPGVGLIGTVDHDCDGTPRNDAFRRLADVHRKYLWPLWWWRSTRRFSTPLIGRGRWFADVYRSLDRAGARRGRYVQGGSYAIHADLLAAWLADGRLNRPEAWLNAPLGEDMAFSIWAVQAGFGMEDFNRPGEVFGVKNAGLPLPPAELIACGYGVVHSVKTGNWDEELANVAALDAAVLVYGQRQSSVPS